MGMTIVEALKEVKLVEKRIAKNCESISQYASVLSNEKPAFDSEEEQRAMVKQLIQANMDLTTQYLRLKKNIEFTNLSTIVELAGKKYSIFELIHLRRKAGEFILRTFSCLTETASEQKRARFFAAAGQDVKVNRMFNESDKMKSLNEWQEFIEKIDGKLEVVNATTEILEA